MSKKYILTAFSADRPGIVADISQVIFENDCNLEESAMANLAGEFALIFLFSPLSAPIENDLENILAKECRRLERDKGITAFFREVYPAAQTAVQENTGSKTITVEGLDHAGIVYRISRFLADKNINIRNLRSEMKSSPESGAALYSMAIDVDILNSLSHDAVEQGLRQIGDELLVDIVIE